MPQTRAELKRLLKQHAPDWKAGRKISDDLPASPDEVEDGRYKARLTDCIPNNSLSSGRFQATLCWILVGGKFNGTELRSYHGLEGAQPCASFAKMMGKLGLEIGDDIMEMVDLIGEVHETKPGALVQVNVREGGFPNVRFLKPVKDSQLEDEEEYDEELDSVEEDEDEEEEYDSEEDEEEEGEDEEEEEESDEDEDEEEPDDTDEEEEESGDDEDDEDGDEGGDEEFVEVEEGMEVSLVQEGKPDLDGVITKLLDEERCKIQVVSPKTGKKKTMTVQLEELRIKDEEEEVPEEPKKKAPAKKKTSKKKSRR